MNQQTALNQYAAHTGNVKDLHFKKIGNNLVDVFKGEGFQNPTRYRLIKGTWTWISGPKPEPLDHVLVVAALGK